MLTTLAALNFGGQTVFAEVKNFHAESFYQMNRGEPIKDAQDKIFKASIKMISEKAGVVVESLTPITLSNF